MAPPIAELTARAQTLTSAGDFAGARDVLAPALDPADTDPQRASADLATAAALLARILITLGDPHTARLWAGFAHAAEERLHGPHDDRTLQAAATHAAVLARVGNHGRAAQLYHDLVLELTAAEGRESGRVLAAEADLATAEHAAGQCTAARSRLAEAWARHRRVYGDGAPAGIKMLARLGAMERECGRSADAREHLGMAQELCARYLTADHPLGQQVARLIDAAPSGRHVCGRVRQSTGPVADAVAPGVHALHSQPEPYRPTRDGRVREGSTRDGRAGDGRVREGSTRDGRAGDGRAEGGSTSAGLHTLAPHPQPPVDEPDMPPPDNRITDPQGAVYQQPLYFRDLHQPPGEPIGRHARADSPLPMPGQQLPDYAADGRRLPFGTAPVGRGEMAVRTERRLPVPVIRPPSPRQPFILAALLVAGIGVGAAVVAATLPRSAATPLVAVPSAAPPAPAATASPSASRPATVPGAPTGVRLRDNRDSVTLTWTYPKGAEGPVLISGGRRGEQQRAFQELPAGSADYMVYGLNQQLDYCFTIAVVHATDRVAASPPVCTSRR